MNPLPPLSSEKAALTVETPLSSRRSSSTRMVSPRENVSIVISSEHPPPPRTHSSLPGEVWSIARHRASYSRELQTHEILGSLVLEEEPGAVRSPRLSHTSGSRTLTVSRLRRRRLVCHNLTGCHLGWVRYQGS